MSERVKLEVTLQTVRNGETQNTRVLIACLVGDTKSNILSTGSLFKNGWAIQMSSDEFSMKHSSGLECQLIEWGGCPWISCKGVSGVSQLSSGEFGMDYSPMSFIVHVDTCLMIQAASIALLRNLLVNTNGRTRTRKVGSSWSCIQISFSLAKRSFWLLQIYLHTCLERCGCLPTLM